MGNSGSVHNLNWDSSASGFTSAQSKSELNGYIQRSRQIASMHQNETKTHTLLRRQLNQNSARPDRSKSFPAASEQFRVLPKIEIERHKLLRPTTNGMLLNAGGTISGRNKDDIRAPGQMQRSRTLIFDQRDVDGENNRNDKFVIPSFQRSQTLLHLSYKEHGNADIDESKKFSQRKVEGKGENATTEVLRHARSEPDFRNDLNKPTQNRKSGLMDNANVPATAVSTRATKLTKYNKKRKAPPAPSTTVSDKVNSLKNTGRAENSENVAPLARRFKTNINVRSAQQQQQQQKPTQQTRAMAPPIYRREKSSDAILLRNKEENAANATEKRFSSGSKISDDRPLKTLSTIQNTTAKTPSKIPQLKRTFYFGMQNTATTTTVGEAAKSKPKESLDIERSSTPIRLSKVSMIERQKEHTVFATPAIVTTNQEAAEFSTLNYRLHNDNENAQRTNGQAENESQINDNGISIHIRPALPRRQLEVPTFSPAAAWRMLSAFEDEGHKQLTAKTSSNSMNCESPIQLRSKKLALEMDALRREEPTLLQKSLRKENVQTIAWTPLQDLGDDDDDINNDDNNDTSSTDDFEGAKDEEDGLLFFNGSSKGRNDIGMKNKEKNSTGVHMFSLSLPRESHLDAQLLKKSFLPSNNNDKTSGFSSLQKLKLTMSTANKCTCRAAIKFSTSNIESGIDQETCEIHRNRSMIRSDNWVLHKTGTKEGANVTTPTSNNGKLLNDDVIPTVEPISLTYLTGGQHIMYLPGISTTTNVREHEENSRGLMNENELNRDPSKTASARQRQRKKETRESLQDETSDLRPQQSQSQTQQQTQRFRFQSTVRLMEKRRLAERLSRDAEIREAQRKSELEAMKRVEEDFQRKRASEKANIRHQLRLYCSGNGNDAIKTSNIREQYNSLPVFQHHQHPHDNNNNKIPAGRADPDGAAASPSPAIVVDAEKDRFVHQISHLPLKRLDSDCGDSDFEGQNADIAHFNRTASLVEPYLQSFMK